MKIGILTFHWATNYGAILQCYALQQYLISQGHDVEIINYKPKQFDFSWKKYIKHPLAIRNIKKDYTQNKKEQSLKIFRNTYLNQTKRFYSYKDLEKTKFDYDIVISGSDQILNPSFTIQGEGCPTSSYYLTFLPESIIKVGYAVSFGCISYPSNAFNYASEWIKIFKKIGVRENTGKNILDSFGYSGDVAIVPDPTLVDGRCIFDKIRITRPSIDNYLCAYILRKHIKISHNKDVFYIDEINNPLSMEEWLGYIAYSKGLVTNSYHGMIVAILFHIPFVVFLENNKGNGMNDRFLTLLDRIGLCDRIASDYSMIDSVLSKEINWNFVDNMLNQYSAIGRQFLRF